METIVELEGVNGEWFNLTEADRGIWLATDPKGLYDPPVKVVYEEPGNYPGARFLNARILRRDITFMVYILDDTHDGGESWLSRDSDWRKAWAFDRDCKLHITTDDSGTRTLKLRLGESPDVDLKTDPKLGKLNQVIMTCIAGDPFWYEDDVVYSAVTTEDTTFDPNPLPWPWPQEAIPTETLTISVDPSDGKHGLNPTDQDVFLKWTVPGSTQAPALPYIPGIPWLGAPNSPACIWTIPDYDFAPLRDGEPDLSNRRLRMPPLIGGLRTNEVQGVYINGAGGVFKLGFGSETTANIGYNANAATVKAALVALAGITGIDVDVVQAPAINESQTITQMGGATGGTYTITYDGQTTGPIGHNDSAIDLYIHLTSLSNIGYADIGVAETVTNETQIIQLTGEATGGTFTLTLDGETTAPIPWNADPLTLAVAIANLSTIGLFDVSATKDIFTPYSPYVVEFHGDQTGININALTGDPSGLSGGAGMGINVTTKTQGGRPVKVTFQGALAGVNVPTMTTNPTNLTGGDDPSVLVTVNNDGSRPYVITFVGNLSGVDVPTLTVDATGLTGADPTGRVVTQTEGFTFPAENAVIDTDPRVEQVSSESGSPLWSRMNGVRFRNPVPAYTKSKDFEITVSGCVVGQMVTMRIPRPWTRPWGLE